MRKTLLFLGLALSLSACATSFTGSADVSGGVRGCYDRCRADGMQMGAFVYLGEYSTGCVCEPTGQGTARAEAGAGGAAVGVVMQMRAAAAQRQQY